ncbi:RICIN domain-containing protein [Streptomyces mirabilis]|uniref:RICIN domain-containing protein n=1 Tax=Streptomyces mirabilis TaxID=68239 RepID=UPI0009459043|nr:RICIN domain-containing protein [Streptomyces mirabilis]
MGVSIWSHATGRCIDVSGGQGKDGTPLDIWDCGSGARMTWQFRSDGTVRAMGKCMDVAWGSTADGATIQLANCSGNPAQRFRLNPAHDLVNPQADKCRGRAGQGHRQRHPPATVEPQRPGRPEVEQPLNQLSAWASPTVTGLPVR